VLKQPFDVMKKSNFVDKVGAEHFCPNIDAALEHAEVIVVEEKRRRMEAEKNNQ
jgi:SulP family sulfate permease